MGCLALLWRLTHREGIGLGDLIGFDRSRLGRDLLVGLALIPIGLALILGGIYATGWLVYGTLKAPYLFGRLPLPAALYGVFVFPFVWGLTEQMMPLTFDPKFMAFRALSPLPFSIFQTLLYLRMRRLIPFAVAHALMDAASGFIGVLLPLLAA